ncbi:hypothetical protein T11_14881 [Trichinella zimbabwensis]|uniref:Uncharacterized protein n=1 Tax=Trichinella zimbabwensis TaxID=268475 RepID=A0A0V1GFY6_9BILA|nr:hypothetical protein T11_14881 [Trichinella zimbabwensis]
MISKSYRERRVVMTMVTLSKNLQQRFKVVIESVELS